MIESVLLQMGLRCGTVKNFSNTISNDVRKGERQHWYFLTPFKTTETPSQLKECTVKMAFPFLANREDLSEALVYKRLTPFLATYESELLKQLRKTFKIVTVTEFYPIAFWANEKGERTERKVLGVESVHIFSASVTIKYRETSINCNC
jgi:hypothetical protein